MYSEHRAQVAQRMTRKVFVGKPIFQTIYFATGPAMYNSMDVTITDDLCKPYTSLMRWYLCIRSVHMFHMQHVWITPSLFINSYNELWLLFWTQSFFCFHLIYLSHRIISILPMEFNDISNYLTFWSFYNLGALNYANINPILGKLRRNITKAEILIYKMYFNLSKS